jgi:hypothetical protein
VWCCPLRISLLPETSKAPWEREELKLQSTQAVAILEVRARKKEKERDKARPAVGLQAMAMVPHSPGTGTALQEREAHPALEAVKGRAKAVMLVLGLDQTQGLVPAQQVRVPSLESLCQRMASSALWSWDPLWMNNSPKQRKSGRDGSPTRCI